MQSVPVTGEAGFPWEKPPKRGDQGRGRGTPTISLRLATFLFSFSLSLLARTSCETPPSPSLVSIFSYISSFLFFSPALALLFFFLSFSLVASSSRSNSAGFLAHCTRVEFSSTRECIVFPPTTGNPHKTSLKITAPICLMSSFVKWQRVHSNYHYFTTTSL